MATYAEMDAPTYYATRIQELRDLQDGWDCDAPSCPGEALLPGTEQSRRLGAEAGKVPLKSDLDIVAEITSKLNPTHVFDITPHPVGDIYLEIMRLSGKYEGIVGVISKGTIEVTGYPVNFLPMDEAQMNEQVTYKTFTSDQIPECATFINQLLQ